MKVGVLTFAEADNYGAMLQAYALQKHIASMGYHCELIRYRNDKVWNSYHLASLKERGSFASFLKKNLELALFKKRTKSFHSFRNDLEITGIIGAEDLSIISAEYDKVIVGSDQVWNPKNTNGDLHFLLDFVDDDRKKIAYAASFGNTDYFKEFGSGALEYISMIPYLSTRESSGKRFIESQLNRRVELVCDPVFLLKKEEWERFVDKYEFSPYIFVYTLDPNPELVQYVNAISKKEKLRIIVIPGIINTLIPFIGIKNAKIILGAGPKEMISLIANAKYVVSDSFHGTALSIIMEKYFLTFVNETQSNTGSRIDDILKKFNISERKRVRSDVGCEIQKPIDYQVVRDILDKWQVSSNCFIKNSIDTT